MRKNFQYFCDITGLIPNNPFIFDANKIIENEDRAKQFFRKMKAENPKKQIVLLHGKFNVPHLGHLLLVRNCRQYLYKFGFSQDEIIIVLGCMSNEYIYDAGKIHFMNSDFRMSILSLSPDVDYIFQVSPSFECEYIDEFFSELYISLGANFIPLEKNDPNEQERLFRNHIGSVQTISFDRSRRYDSFIERKILDPINSDISSSAIQSDTVDPKILNITYQMLRNFDQDYIEELHREHIYNRRPLFPRYAKMLRLIP